MTKPKPVDPATTTPARLAFAERLNEICDDMRVPQRGRQTTLAKRFGVSQQAVRKWLDGLTWPETPTILALAEWGNVNVNWLWQGNPPKRGLVIDTKALVLDEVLHSLPPDISMDVIDGLRAKLTRHTRVTAQEPPARFGTALDAYEHDLQKRRNQGST